MNTRRRPFLTLWVLAVLATTAGFTLHLAIRVKAVELGYELGREHANLGRLREVRRVLQLEVASHRTPERVDFIARNLLGMSEPPKERIFPGGKMPTVEEAESNAEQGVAQR